jgi:hypothetical protein
MGFLVTKRIRFAVGEQIMGSTFLGSFCEKKNEKCLESPEMARKLRTCAPKVSASVEGGLTEGSSV